MGFLASLMSTLGFSRSSAAPSDDVAEAVAHDLDEDERDYEQEAVDDFTGGPRPPAPRAEPAGPHPLAGPSVAGTSTSASPSVDMGPFDFDRDLKAFFRAQYHVERAWEDPDARRAQLRAFGVRDERHWQQIDETFRRYLGTARCHERWGDVGDVMQLKAAASGDIAREEMQARAQGELAGELAPVEGVSLADWARWQAHIAGGGSQGEAILALGIDAARWERVSAEWNARMARDTTFTIATEYGKHFGGAGVGAHGAAGQVGATGLSGASVGSEADAPVPLEVWVELEAAQSAAANAGRDPVAELQRFGFSVIDWSNISTWWSQYLNQNMMKNNGALHRRYTQLQADYEARYASASRHSDLSL